MKELKLGPLFAVAAAIALIISGMAVGCAESEDSKEFEPPGVLPLKFPNLPGFAVGLNACMDGVDNNLDTNADRFGVPMNCSVRRPVQITAMGSIYQMYATGWYLDLTPDVYTITVSTGGDFTTAAITATSSIGDTGGAIPGPVPLADEQPVNVGANGLVIYFLDLNGTINLVAGEQWTISTVRVTNCQFWPDPSCFGPLAIEETGLSQCNNFIDDDLNGDVDWLDPQCSWNCSTGTYDPDWTSESTAYTPLCNDGIDNDADGFTDFAGGDPECADDCENSES